MRPAQRPSFNQATRKRPYTRQTPSRHYLPLTHTRIFYQLFSLSPHRRLADFQSIFDAALDSYAKKIELAALPPSKQTAERPFSRERCLTTFYFLGRESIQGLPERIVLVLSHLIPPSMHHPNRQKRHSLTQSLTESSLIDLFPKQINQE